MLYICHTLESGMLKWWDFDYQIRRLKIYFSIEVRVVISNSVKKKVMFTIDQNY
jgi:hypothetical protein